jgi:dynactin-4
MVSRVARFGGSRYAGTAVGWKLGPIFEDQVSPHIYVYIPSSKILLPSELRPLRIPLHSKQSKRCPKCRHILIKPEQKSQSVRYKIKLMAANYLPSIEISLISSQASASASSAVAASVRPKGKQGLPGSADIAAGSPSAILHPGKTYSFQLALTNPLYEPIQVRLTTYRGPPSTKSSDPKAKPPKPPFAVSLPSSAFPISAFAEAWEYDEDDDEMFDDEELEDMIAGRSGERERDKEKSKSGVCVLERKANVTKVGGEVVVSKDGVGDVKVCSCVLIVTIYPILPFRV